MTKFSLIKRHFIQQEELGIPNYIILEKKFDLSNVKATAHLVKVEKKSEVLQTVSQAALPPKNTQNIELREKVSDKREDLANLFYKCKECKACSLHTTRKRFVFGAGTAFTDVMVIGEAPGEDEDLQGLPFVGRAGQLLTKMLASINLRRDEIFIANILKCRPPGNRKPNPQEIATCFPILKRQIDIIKPKAILLLGGTAANAVLNNDKTVGSLRGVVHYYESIPLIVSYHPSALLRDERWKRPAWDDLQKFERLLKELRNAQ
jgi:DNA polymerase